MSERRDDLQGFKDVCCSSQTLPGTALTRPKRNVVWLKWEPTGHHSNKEKTGLRVPKIPFTHWKETLSHPVLVVILLQQRAVMGTSQHSQQSLLPLWYKHLFLLQKTLKPLTFLSVPEEKITSGQTFHLLFPSALGRWSSFSSFPTRRPRSRSTLALGGKAAVSYTNGSSEWIHAGTRITFYNFLGSFLEILTKIKFFH